MALTYLERVTTDRANFETKVRAIASKYRFDPNWLMIIMNFETAGKFLPGYYSTSNAVGLIQFTTVGAAQVKLNKDQLAQLSAVQQLDYVDKYYGSLIKPGQIQNLTDCYLVVFAPAFIGKPANSKIYISPSIAYNGNKALDTARKGYITVGDVTTVINKYRGGYEDSFINDVVLAGVGNTGTILLLLLFGGIYLKNRKQS